VAQRLRASWHNGRC